MKKVLRTRDIKVQTYRKSLDFKLDRISHFIAMNGPSNKKTLENRLKIDKPTVYKAVDQLLEAKRLKVSRREMAGMVKYYDLTRLGLMHVVLFEFEEAGEDAEKISGNVKTLFTRYPDWLPDVASIWPAIEEASRQENREISWTSSLETLALNGLVSICEDEIARDLWGGGVWLARMGIDVSGEHVEPASRLIYNWLLSHDSEYGPRWLKAVQRNPVLREVAMHAIEKRTHALEDLATELKSLTR